MSCKLRSATFSLSSALRFFVSAAMLLSFGSVSRADLILTPAKVSELALSQGLQTRAAQLDQQRANLALSQALGLFDLELIVTPGYEYNKAQLLSGQGNILDRTFTLGSTLSKRFATGTALSLDYIDTRQSSILSAFTAQNRPPRANLNSFQIALRQSLFANAFGEADRASIEIARTALGAAADVRDEAIEETLIQVMTLFWNAYVAERNHRVNENTVKRYQDLIKDVRRRKGYALGSPGEQPRLEAELKTAQVLERSSLADYTNAANALLTALRISTTEPVALEVPPEVPPLPELPGIAPETLRSVKVAEINRLNADRNLAVVESRVRPSVDLVARARTTGVDPVHESARLEMTSLAKPTYFVGVELVAPLWSEGNKGLLADARVQKLIAENDAAIATDSARRDLDAAALTLRARFEVVSLTNQTVESREKVVAELDRAYRQGREPLVEVIRAYNELSQARFDRATAVGQYNLALLRLSASRDELVKAR